MKTIYSKHTPKGDKCCDPWHVRGLEYNYYVTPRIHLMRVYGTCVIRLIHHYACECIIKELGASILGAIHHEQAGSGCWAVQNKVNSKGLYARKLDTLQTNKLWLGRTTQEEGPRYRYWKWKKTLLDTTPDHFTLLSILPLDRDMRCICNFDSSPTPPRNETAQVPS